MKFKVIQNIPDQRRWNVFRVDSTADYELFTWIGKVEWVGALNSPLDYASCKFSRMQSSGFIEALYFDSQDAAIKDVIS